MAWTKSFSFQKTEETLGLLVFTQYVISKQQINCLIAPCPSKYQINGQGITPLKVKVVFLIEVTVLSGRITLSPVELQINGVLQEDTGKTLSNYLKSRLKASIGIQDSESNNSGTYEDLKENEQIIASSTKTFNSKFQELLKFYKKYTDEFVIKLVRVIWTKVVVILESHSSIYEIKGEGSLDNYLLSFTVISNAGVVSRNDLEINDRKVTTGGRTVENYLKIVIKKTVEELTA